MPEHNALLCILIVEDNPADLFVLEGLLWKTRLPIGQIVKAKSNEEADLLLKKEKPNLILLDLSLPDSVGIESFKHINNIAPNIPIIVLTGLSDMDMALETMAAGAQDYLVKAEFDEKLLSKSIQYSIERKRNLENTRVSNERYNIVVKATNDAVWEMNLADQTVLWVGDNFKKTFGYDLVDVYVDANDWIYKIHPEDRDRVQQSITDAYSKSGSPYWKEEYRFLKSNGQYAYVLDRGYIIYENDQPIRMIGAMQDITERKENAEMILLSEKRYRSLFYYNPMAIFIWDLQSHQILEVNDMAEKEYGYTRDEFVQLTLWDLRTPDNFGKLKLFIEHIASSVEMDSGGTWEHITKTGERIFMNIFSHRIQYNGKDAVMAIAQNVTGKLLLEKKLEEERLIKQKEIAEAVINTQENERHDISRELHDNVNQQLTVAMMYIASAEKKQQPGSDLLRQSADFILHAIEEIRRLSKGLVTPLIKDFGLVKAIESVLEDFSAVNDMKIDFVSDTFFEDDIHYDFKLSIFRIVQEQVNNVLKHSGATELKIDLGRNNNSIYLSIYDNGVGFDLAVQKKGIGLYNITSRVELFNGTISIHTAPTSGCAMHMSFPITQDIMRH